MSPSSKEQRKGEFYIFFGGVLWAFFPVITILSFGKLPSLISLAWSTLFSAVFFFFVVLFRNKWYELWNWELWKYSFLIVLFIGIIFYGLYFIGLTKTSAGNAAIITLFDIFTSFLLFSIIKKEPFSFEHTLGALLMIVGAAIVLAPGFSGINVGDFIILAGTFFTPIGNHFQQKARKIASSEMIMFLRSTITTPFLFIIAFIFHQQASTADINASLLFLFVNGFLLLGLSKLFWIEAIHRISVTKGSALSSINPFLTLIIAWVFLHQAPTLWQFLSLIPLVLGVLLLTDQFVVNKRLSRRFDEFITSDRGV